MFRAIGARMADTGNDGASVVVVGAGITGLAAAHAIHRARPDVSVVVLEARDRPGGNIFTQHIDGFVVDAGPDSFLKTKPGAIELCRELGIDSELVPTREIARHVYIAHEGRLELLPGGMALAVPTRLEPLLRTPLLSLAGKLRILAEPFVPRGSSAADESIDSFFARRIGKEGATRLASPLLGGIYAGDTAALSIAATFPELVQLEQRYGSLLRGFLAKERATFGQSERAPTVRDVARWLRRAGAANAPSPFLSFKGGMGTLIDAVVGALPPGSVRTGVAVTAIERAGSGWNVRARSETIAASAVVIAAPAYAAARLLASEGLESELGAVPYLSTATVFFALDRDKVRHPLDGFGFIVPDGEAKILASTWVSSKWDGRAPEGGVLVRAFIGGARDTERVATSTDAELETLARSELERFMGPLGPARFTRVYRYERANPQPAIGHRARLERIRTRLAALSGVYVAGAAYDGVGLPDCVRQARTAASDVVQRLSQEGEARASV